MQMDQLSQAINPVIRSGVLACSCRFKAGVCVLIAAGASVLFGCENAGQGAASGAAVGALSGLVIGSMSGNAGTGAAISGPPRGVSSTGSRVRVKDGGRCCRSAGSDRATRRT